MTEKKEKSVKENFTTKYTIHGENKSFFDWTGVVKSSRSVLSHGIVHGTYDKSNELIEPPFITTKG